MGKGELAELRSHSVWRSFLYNLSRVKALSIGTIVGSIVGIIPGAGGQIAGLVAYDQTKKMSKDPSRFGKGEPDGVIAAESANNAMVGPSLVPLLTLGIPGSPTAAVLLGGLLINGLFPGPDLFTVHAAVTWTFIDSLLVGQVFMMIFGLMIARYSIFAALLVALIAGAMFRVSYFQDNSEAYLFPIIISAMMLGMSLLSLAREAFSLCVDDFQPFPFIRLVPALVMMAGGVALVETLGMYTTAFLVLCLVSIWYSSQEDSRRRLFQSLVFAAGFSAFTYVLFSLMLNVQVPRGLII